MRTLKSKSMQQSRNEQENHSFGKLFCETRTCSCRERHDSFHMQSPLFIQESVRPKTKWLPPVIRIVVNSPKINKHCCIPRDKESRVVEWGIANGFSLAERCSSAINASKYGKLGRSENSGSRAFLPMTSSSSQCNLACTSGCLVT